MVVGHIRIGGKSTMSNNLFKALCFLFLAVVFIVAKVLGISIYSDVLTICCVAVLVVLAIVFFIKYQKERKNKKE